MKECQQTRKACHDRHNTWLRERFNTPDSSLLGSAAFSNEISLHSLSLNSDDRRKPRSRTPNCSEKTYRNPILAMSLLLDNEYQNISEEDQKILRLMAMRREAAIEEEELAFSARNIWAVDRILDAKASQEKQRSWNQYITEKRKLERLDRLRRQKEREERLRSEKVELEAKINDKHGRVERKQREISLQKRMSKSNSTSNETLHKLTKQQQEEEETFRNMLQINLCQARERQSEYMHRRMVLEKYKKIRESSHERDVKWQAARDMREELNRKLEEEQKDNKKRYTVNQALSEYRVNWALDWKRKMLLEKNAMRKEHHSFILSKLKEDDQQKEALARQAIMKKDLKLKYMRDLKDVTVTKSRMNARVAANLRQTIQSTYSLNSLAC